MSRPLSLWRMIAAMAHLLISQPQGITTLCSVPNYTAWLDLLILCLERQFGLRGVVLQWFRSYLSDRSFRVLGSNSSFVVHLLCSVPQGSVLGPHMFIMYTADLADSVAERQVNFHSFADDMQTYLHCYPVM